MTEAVQTESSVRACHDAIVEILRSRDSAEERSDAVFTYLGWRGDASTEPTLDKVVGILRSNDSAEDRIDSVITYLAYGGYRQRLSLS